MKRTRYPAEQSEWYELTLDYKYCGNKSNSDFLFDVV